MKAWSHSLMQFIRHCLQVSLWSDDSGLEDACGMTSFHTDLSPIPCMADELEHFSEQLTHSLPCSKPELPLAPVLQNCMSSSNVRALSGGRCGSGKVALPVIYTAPLQARPAAAPVEGTPPAEDPPVAAAAPPFEGLVTTVEAVQQDVKGEEEYVQLSPSLRAVRMQLPRSLTNAIALRDGRSLPFAGAWRGCIKSSWCNRENRHRGVCNTRAEVPGLAAYGAEQLAAAGVRPEDFPGQLPLQGIKEEQEPAGEELDHSSEQASATEVLLECGGDGEAQCLDSGVPRNRQIRPDPQSEPGLAQGQCRPRKLPRLVTKQPQLPPSAFNPGGPPTPDLQAPHFASQDSSDSADSNIQRETDASSREVGAADEEEVRCRAQADQNVPPKPKPAAAAKSTERPRRMSPSTPEACAAPKLTSELAKEGSSKRSLQVAQGPEARSPVAVSPFASSLSAQASVRTATAAAAGNGGGGGFVQTSSGRIARPTPKTAASRASSSELSELSHTEGQKAPLKRKSGRPSKGGEKSKRRRMVGGMLKTVGHAAPGQQCTQCGTQVTPVWRAGPYGPKTLCNACGVRYMKQVKKK
ncbi:probable GATA transcription factor 9 at C-terminar half [Coccomyxa sp. Obi]|nr:probable GATA transcription factor 9 at C-terminar half [Coccomyxa sp. Obi]BDA45192.1 probable GATA transcription factor 9 at C-terminar half [Coccomyxa sp. Obi]